MGQGLGIKIPKVKLGNVFGTVAGVVEDALKDKPEYLVSYSKGKEPAKLYAGQLQKDGSVKFSEIKPGQLDKFNPQELPQVQTLAQMKASLAGENTPAKLASALDIAARVDARLVAAGAAHNATTDADRTALSRKGAKPGELAATADQTRTDVIRELNDELKTLKSLKDKDHPELKEIAPGSNPPVTIREAMTRSIQGALENLQPAERLSTAVDAFTSQIVNAPAPGTAPTAAPAYNF